MRQAERLLARQARHSSGSVDWEDIDIARSNWAFNIDPRYLFDGDSEKAFNVPAGGALPAFTIMFNKPLFIGQCQMVTSDPSRFDTALGAVITWIAADGGAVPPGVGVGPLAAPQTDRAAIAPPAWPAPIVGVQITVGLGLGVASNVSEFIMENCSCVHAVVAVGPIALSVDDTPDEPLFVQDLQQMVNEEVTVVLTAPIPPAPQWVGAGTRIFDKDVTTGVTNAGVGTITITPHFPILINRIAFYGNCVNAVVDVVDIEDNVHIIEDAIVVAHGWDSGNFEPVLAKSIHITEATGPIAIFEVTVLKVIENKSFSEVQLPELVEFSGQKVFWDQLDTNKGGAPALKPYMLTRIPLEINADDDPAAAGALDATVVATVAGAEDALITAQFHEYSRDIRKVRNFARAMVTVECGLNCRITRVGSRIGKRNVDTDAITWITAEKLVTLNVDGAALRHVCLVHEDWVTNTLGPDVVLVWQVRVLGYRTAGAIAVPATLWHTRGTTECKLDTEIIVQASEVLLI
jgi:hypothetical protein